MAHSVTVRMHLVVGEGAADVAGHLSGGFRREGLRDRAADQGGDRGGKRFVLVVDYVADHEPVIDQENDVGHGADDPFREAGARQSAPEVQVPAPCGDAQADKDDEGDVVSGHGINIKGGKHSRPGAAPAAEQHRLRSNPMCSCSGSPHTKVGKKSGLQPA